MAVDLKRRYLATRNETGEGFRLMLAATTREARAEAYHYLKVCNANRPTLEKFTVALV